MSLTKFFLIGALIVGTILTGIYTCNAGEKIVKKAVEKQRSELQNAWDMWK